MNTHEFLEQKCVEDLEAMSDNLLADHLRRGMADQPNPETTSQLRQSHLQHVAAALDSRGEPWAASDVLELHHESMEPVCVPVADLPVTVGRGKGDSVRIISEQMSRGHCRLQRSGSLLTVVDLDSKNGTFVNDVQVAHEDLCDGDWLRVGSVPFRIRRS